MTSSPFCGSGRTGKTVRAMGGHTENHPVVKVRQGRERCARLGRHRHGQRAPGGRRGGPPRERVGALLLLLGRRGRAAGNAPAEAGAAAQPARLGPHLAAHRLAQLPADRQAQAAAAVAPRRGCIHLRAVLGRFRVQGFRDKACREACELLRRSASPGPCRPMRMQQIF